MHQPLHRNEARLAEFFTAVWILVTVVLLGRLGVGTARLRKIVNAARPVTSDCLADLMFSLENEIGIRRTVEIRVTGADLTPLTVGILRPVILLPEQIHRWPDETCKAVLMHELFHIKRFDYLLHMLVNIVQAVYWINPFVLRCAGSFHAEQEVTCDDQVILNGVKSKAYARQMLSVAMAVASPRFSLPFWNGAADRMELERRVLSVLNAGKNREPPGPRSFVWTLLLCLLLIVPLSALKFTEFSPTEFGAEPLMQGCWAKLEGGNRLLISDDCRLLIAGAAYFQAGWKDKSLEFPSGSSFLVGGDKLAGGYLDEQRAEILVYGKSADPDWRLCFEPESRRVVLRREPGAPSARLECVNRQIIPDCGPEKYKSNTNKIATFINVDIRDREQIFSNRQGLAFVVLAVMNDAPENHSRTGPASIDIGRSPDKRF